jgi:hypothetical protein
MNAVVEKDPATIDEYERIFERYLEVCNQAIEKNKDRFPYTEIWRARWKNLGANNLIQCAIYDDRPKAIYTLQLTEDMKIKILKKTHETSDDIWPFKYSYLKHVVESPESYIENPDSLDWGWLKMSLG